MLNLREIAIESKESLVEFPGYNGFKVRLAYVSRQLSKEMLDATEVKEYKHGVHVNTSRDQDKFAELYCAAAIKGWEGLTLDTVSSLMLLDIGERDLTTEVPYSEDNAIMLFTKSIVFQNFIDRSVFEVDTFRS